MLYLVCNKDKGKEVIKMIKKNYLEIDTDVRGNEVYTKKTAESLPLYLGTMKLIEGIWNLVSADESGNIVAVEYETTALSTLNALNDELKSISIEDVQKLNDFNTDNMGKILAF